MGICNTTGCPVSFGFGLGLRVDVVVDWLGGYIFFSRIFMVFQRFFLPLF